MAETKARNVTGSYLDRIIEHTKARLELVRKEVPIELLEEQAQVGSAPRDFLKAVRSEGISLIAEIKRRSPSAGPIDESADPAIFAEAYERGGARAISVLTEPDFFSGSRSDLEAARASCALPILRKDFVIEPYQVVESASMGADAVLLIVAAIPDSKLLKDLHSLIESRGMTPLVEVHNEPEFERAIALLPVCLGINQRDLRSFEVDKTLAARLRPEVDPGIAVVAESGIWSREDVVALEEAKVDGVLVGESLMRSRDPASAVASLLGAAV